MNSGPKLALLWCACAVPAHAQTFAAIRLVLDDIVADRRACSLFEVRDAVTSGNAPAKDTLTVAVYSDRTFNTLAPPKADLVVAIEGGETHTLAGSASSQTFELDAGGLTGRTVIIRRAKGLEPLCAVTPRPTPTPQARVGLRTTQFIADGAVATGLRSGSGSQLATGSLGIDHRDIRSPTDRPRYIISLPYPEFYTTGGPFIQMHRRLRRLPLGMEQLRALITVASSIDTLGSRDPITFRRALLSPSAVARGRSGSGSIDYHASSPALAGRHGPRFAFAFSQATWRVEKTDPATGRDTSITADAALVSVDARWRWTPIEQLQDPKGNDFAFAIEAGWTWRTIAGDARARSGFLLDALGTTRDKFSGPAAAFVVSLRQVTATADLPFLRGRGENLEGLTGMQPIVTINFSAPMFTF